MWEGCSRHITSKDKKGLRLFFLTFGKASFLKKANASAVHLETQLTYCTTFAGASNGMWEGATQREKQEGKPICLVQAGTQQI